jgi:hypothetical protein
MAALLGNGRLDGPSVANPGRSFFSVAPPMRCSDIVWVIVSPRPSHSFGISVVWHNVVATRELLGIMLSV